MRVVRIICSKNDVGWAKRVMDVLDRFGVSSVLRVASAHKTPLKVLDIIKEYEGEDVVFVTIAGRSNALSGFVDAHTTIPVISCPRYSDKFAGADIFSSLRMPSGVAPMVVLEPEQAGLAAAKILGLLDKGLNQRIGEYQDGRRREVEESDVEVTKSG
ncbi:MAG: 5-(carboxyamino)imidazole ribonucleotide mutase [Methanobacteriota archaeon]|nr:MAG: 5-(carboxyamino)imidazole ribonucleotide mutase [Euryarchaeota archaeon]